MANKNIISIKCNSCGAPLETEEGNPIGFCPYCGAKYDVYSLTKDSDEIELAKLGYQAYQEAEVSKQQFELEKIRQEREWQKNQQEITEEKEKVNAFRKGGLKIFLIVLLIIFALCTAVSFHNGTTLCAVIGIIQTALVIFAWLTASRTVKLKIPGLHIFAVIISLLLIIPYINAFNYNHEEQSVPIEWENIVLNEFLPVPPSNLGKIRINSADSLMLDIEEVSDKDFDDYKKTCVKQGFNVDQDASGISFEAFDKAGYKLNLIYYGSQKSLSITLSKPMELSEIEWPKNELTNMLPVPKSKTGKISSDNSDHFFVYLGKTSLTDYNAYVQSCSEQGFNVDYQKGDDYYYADNKEGYSLSLNYKGGNIISVEICAPKAETTDAANTAAPISNEKTEAANTTTIASHIDGIAMPFSAAAFESKNYSDVVERLTSAGFTNVKAIPLDDLKIALLHDEGDVKEVSVDGETDFLSEDRFPADAEIIIYYHSYPPESKMTKQTEGSSTEVSTTASDTQNILTAGIRPEIKEAIDSYEAFYNEYTEFMHKYQDADSASSLLMLTDYLDYLSKLEEYSEKMDALENDLNDAELAYYLEATLRIEKKMLEIIQ